MNPFSARKEKQVLQLGEHGLIRKIKAWLGSCSPEAPYGIGDDAALLNFPVGPVAAAKDCLVYRKHFDDSTPPELAGAKLLNRNISDLAAMGAQPAHALLACLLPPSTSFDWLRQFYLGLKEVAESNSIALVGGDITSTFEDLAFSLTLLGSGAKQPLTRKSAQPDDTLWVTGSLGGSLLGKHLYFKPRLKEGRWLADHPGVTSAIDVSDGLATDLHNLCPQDCNIVLDTDSLPLSEAAHTQARKTNLNPIEHALMDGEDYELLFTLDSAIGIDDFLTRWKQSFSTPVTCIGSIGRLSSEPEKRVQYRGAFKNFKGRGYEHF